ncbi:MAG: transglutaminase domain-containing protein [Chloroflexi bacterium]|nr:transglutaminase domain-containing protein [Chloroflexota bacterium]MDA1219802.1 transglutaminase domain-containing protein [Chloroflexota bacterium]
MTPGSVANMNPARNDFSFESLQVRGWALIQAFRPSDGWVSVALLSLNLLTIVWSVERADWAPTPNLAYVMLLAMLTGLLLSRVPIWTVLLLPVGLAVGLLVAVWQLTSFQSGGIELANSAELWQRLDLWLDAALAGGINIDPLPFAFGLVSATWLSGYFAAWAFFRYRNFWGVFILGGAGILSNLTYLPDTASIDLALYLITALLLVGRVQAVRRRQEWRCQNFQYDSHLGWLALSDTIFIGFAVMLIAFLLPVGGHWDPAHSVYERLRSPIVQWQDDFHRLFAGLPARRPLPYRIWGDSIAFQGTINPTTTPVLQVNSPVAMYWKARSYGTYTPKGWVSSNTMLRPTDWSPAYSNPQPYLERFDVTFAVTPNYASKSLFAGGQILSVDQDVRIETYDSPEYIVDLQSPRRNLGTHPGLALAAISLEMAIQQGGGTISDSNLSRGLPPGLELAEVLREQGVVQEVTLVEVLPDQPDTLSVRSAQGTIKPAQTYQVTSSVSLAQPNDLRMAGVDYPIWAVDKYTQLPPELPQRVRDLASQLTADATTPYDKAKAIEAYLKTITYNLTIDPPPYNADGVDYFLFEQQEGYSEYFGSAMTVLLRTQGIPARLVTGYTVGDKIPDHDVYIVTDSHSHAWSEVFFPGYGWISFEPTPGETIPGAAVPAPPPPADTLNAGRADLSIFCEDDEDECDDDTSNPQNQGNLPGDEILSVGQRLAQALPWILAIVIVSTLALGFGWFFWRRYLASSDSPEATFRRLAYLGALNSVALADHQTPYQYRERLEQAFPAHKNHLSTIINQYVRSQYGNKELSGEERQGLVRAWLSIRLPLLFHLLRRRTNESA